MAARCSLAVRDSLRTSICCLLSENWLVSVSSLVCKPSSSLSFLERSCFTCSIYKSRGQWWGTMGRGWDTDLWLQRFSYTKLVSHLWPCSSWTWYGFGKPPSVSSLLDAPHNSEVHWISALAAPPPCPSDPAPLSWFLHPEVNEELIYTHNAHAWHTTYISTHTQFTFMSMTVCRALVLVDSGVPS